MSLVGGTLFREDPYEDLQEIKEERLDDISSTHSNPAIDEIPNITEEEFIEQTMNEVGLNIPSFDYDKLRREERGSPGNESLWVELLVKGNVDLLEFPPLDDDFSQVEVNNVNGQWLEWTVSIEGKTGEEVSQEIEEKLNKMEEGLDALRPRLEDVNESLRERAKEEFQTRTANAEKNSDTLDDIDITTPDEQRD